MKRIFAFVLAFALLGCAGSLPSPSPSPTPLPAGTKAAVIIKYGVGGYALSSAMGPGKGTFTDAMLGKFGTSVAVISYNDWTDNITALMNSVPSSVKLMLFGDSCGASEIPFDAATVKRIIDLIGGFQPSIYCPSLGYYESVPSNVRNAIEVYNPSCPETGGLGCRLWQAGSATSLTIVQRPDMHPGVDPDAEVDMLQVMAGVMNAGALAKAQRGGTRTLVRYHGQRL